MIENFVFNDVVLYSKGWYKKTDLVSDLGYIFSTIYTWTPETEEEVARFMLMAIDHLYTELDNTQIKLNPPHFGKKEHFRLGIMFGEYPISQTYTEMNRRVNNFFNRNKHD